MFLLDAETVLKPVVGAEREVAFYRAIPAALRPFTAAFKGTQTTPWRYSASSIKDTSSEAAGLFQSTAVSPSIDGGGSILHTQPFYPLG